MNQYQCEVYCDVCGEPGVATPKTAARAWLADYIVQHDDPDICHENLERKKAKARLEAKLKEQE